MIKNLDISTPVVDFKNMELSIYLAKKDEYVCIFKDGSFNTIKKYHLAMQKLRIDKTLVEIYKGGCAKEIAKALVGDGSSRENSQWRLPNGELLDDEGVIKKRMDEFGADKYFIREVCRLMGIKRARQVN